MGAIQSRQDAAFCVDLKNALLWVAKALDYVGVDDIHHNHRVAYNAYVCSKVLGWSAQKQEFTFFAGLIHDCGVSRTEEHLSLVSTLTPENTYIHCQAGFQALRKCSLLDKFAGVILHHHTHWEELQNTELSSDEKDIAALIFVADRLDAIRARYIDPKHPDLVTLRKDDIINELQTYSGSLFQPLHVDVLCNLIKKDGFWFAMEADVIESLPARFNNLEWLKQDLDLADMIELGEFIAAIVDAKSQFTYQHSQKVAELCYHIALGLGHNDHDAQMLYVAGLVHDIGKLRTPDEILHKKGKLTPEEYTYIKRHTIDTSVALKMVFPNSKIGSWASNHHERLDGSGYPYGKTKEELDLPSCIIAVADVFQALSQDRPYRKMLTADKIVEVMQPLAKANKLDTKVFQYVLDNLEECYRISTT